MRRVLPAAVLVPLLTLTLLAQAPPTVAPTEPRTPEEEQKSFRLPPGFEIQLVAAEPDIFKPMNLAFDDRGRLWVTDTLEYPYPAAAGVKPRDTVKVLSNFGREGRARRITTFADGLNIPIGLLPVPGGAIVHSIPNVSRFVDVNGDGKADRRDVLFESFGFKDTHGMTNAFTWGFDGWIYATHGFANESTVRAADGSTLTMKSGNTYRMRADGSRLEPWTFGQVNPFGLGFDALGNLYSSDCHTKPIYQLLRGGFYPSFGAAHDGLGFAPEMMNHLHDSTGIAGLCVYTADNFPKEYHGTVFVGNVVTSRINHDRLDRNGSSPRAVALPDFLVSDDPWFRPVDIKLGPDGALYVADFYNRIIGHYEVPLDHPGRDRERGRIWRISYRDPAKPKKPFGTPAPRTDFTRASVADLIKDLAHPNLMVRTFATNQLAQRNGIAVVQAVRAVMKPESSPTQRVHGLWVLHRCSALDDATLTAAVRDADSMVRVHAQRVLAEKAEWNDALRRLAADGLNDPDPMVVRSAAAALGRHPRVSQVMPLLDLKHRVPAGDTHLLHTVRMALRDQLLSSEVWSQLTPTHWTDADLRTIADVSLGAPTPETAQFLEVSLPRLVRLGEDPVRYVHHIARHLAGNVEAKLLPFLRSHRPEDLNRQSALCRAFAQGLQERGVSLGEPARAYALELIQRLLASANAREAQTGLELAGLVRAESLQESLATLAASPTHPEPLRTAAMTSLANLDAGRHAAVFGSVLNDASAPMGLREHAARLLARANQPTAFDQALRALPVAPARLQHTLAVELAATATGAELLLQAVALGKASPRLLQDRVVGIRLKDSKLPEIEDRIARLTEGLPPAEEAVQKLLQQRRDGFAAAKRNVSHGSQLFEKHCAACHQIAGKGAKIGPQLDGVGVRGLERLLEDVLDPNRNVDQAFRQTSLVLRNGQFVTGLLLREEGEVLVLADAQGKEVRVPVKSVEERSVSQLSPMPTNFNEQLPPADLYDLLEYLLAQRAAVPR